MLERSFHNLLSYLANTQTDKQTLAKTSSLAEVITR